MDKPDVRALAEDVPAEVQEFAMRVAWESGWMIPLREVVARDIAVAIMADRRATRETAKAEGRRQGLEEAAKVAEAFSFAAKQTATEMSPKQLNDLILWSYRIAADIRAIAQKAEG